MKTRATRATLGRWDRSCRVLRIGRLITISQDHSLHTLKPNAARISVGSSGTFSPRELSRHVEDLRAAITLAEAMTRTPLSSWSDLRVGPKAKSVIVIAGWPRFRIEH